jgi:hypothetical protein
MGYRATTFTMGDRVFDEYFCQEHMSTKGIFLALVTTDFAIDHIFY